MCPIYSTIKLANPYFPKQGAMAVEALVDAGATHLCIPEPIALQLRLATLQERELVAADGAHRRVQYAGPVRVSALGRDCFVGALVMGDQVLLGAIPMEDMDWVVSPREQRIAVNPSAPNIPMALAKAGLYPCHPVINP
jgi:clan AA aspartic protease